MNLLDAYTESIRRSSKRQNKKEVSHQIVMFEFCLQLLCILLSLFMLVRPIAALFLVYPILITLLKYLPLNRIVSRDRGSEIEVTDIELNNEETTL